MKTFKEYFEEHCKMGPYFKPFNILQTKILKSLYLRHLAGRVPIFSKRNITTMSELMLTYYEKYPDILKILGNVICKLIPNEKTLDYTTNDVDKWADELYSMVKTGEYVREDAGDMVTTQKMVDDAAKKAGYTIGPVWHGTEKTFYTFNLDKAWAGAFHFAKKRDFAELYAKGKDANLLSVYLLLNNPMKEKDFYMLGTNNGLSKSEAVSFAKSKGYDGIIGSSTIVVFFPSQIKSSAPVTYDDNGNIIPLSQRFQSSIDDIRY